MKILHCFRLALVLACTVTGAAGRLSAQELTGTLYGKVTGQDGALLPGATVTVTSPSLIKTEVRVTNQDGTYRVPALPPGIYTLQYELPGFQTVKREAIALRAGAALAVDAQLDVAGIEEQLTVVGESPIIDVKNPQTTRTVDNALIENVPLKRSFSEILSTAPGVLDSEYAFAPAQTVHGGSVRDNVSNVDGANINDNTVGYTFTDLPFDIIEEVQVTSGGISAEFGQASGAVFNFITKSGGNEFHGGANITVKGSGLQADNLSAELEAQGLTQGSGVKKDLDYGFTFGGPVMRDRIWFFGNIRWVDIERTQPDFPATNPTIDDLQAFLKLTSQLTSSTRLQGSYTQRDYEEFPANASFSTNDAPETWDWAARYQKIIFLSVNQTLGSSTYFEANLTQTLQYTDSQFQSDQPGYQDVVTGNNFGGWPAVRSNYTNREKRNIRASISHFADGWLGGSHNLKAGVETEFAPLWRDYDLVGDLLHRVRNGEPYRVRLYNTPRRQGRHVTRRAGFVQDEWTLKQRLTLNLGLRFEWSEGWQPEQQGGGGRWFPVEDFAAERNAVDWFTTAPRLGLVWDIRGDQRTSLRVAWGRYYVALLNQHMQFGNKNNPGYQEYDWIDTNSDFVFQDGEQGTLRSNVIANRDGYDPDLKNPYTDALHFGVERQIGNDVAISITGIFKWDRDLMETVDVTRPFSAYNAFTAVNPIDDEPMTIYALKPEFQSVQRVQLVTNPTDPVRLYRDYRGVEFLLRRRMTDGWSFQGSLNLGRSYGNVGNSFGASHGGTILYDNPNTLINIEGPLDVDAPVQLKLMGTYMAPWDVVLSGFYTGLSGFAIRPPGSFPSDVLGSYTVRFTRAEYPQIVSESFVDVAGLPRGTNRIDFRHRLSLRAEKQIPMGRGTLGLVVDVFNLFNVNTVTFVQSLRFDHPNFLKPATIEPPRTLQLTARVSF